VTEEERNNFSMTQVKNENICFWWIKRREEQGWITNDDHDGMITLNIEYNIFTRLENNQINLLYVKLEVKFWTDWMKNWTNNVWNIFQFSIESTWFLITSLYFNVVSLGKEYIFHLTVCIFFRK
jgi:hypothetical protein